MEPCIKYYCKFLLSLSLLRAISSNVTVILIAVILLIVNNKNVDLAKAEDPYRYFTWTVSYGNIYPLGIRQQGILINGQFPGPEIYCNTNDNLVINIINLNGIQQRRNSWEDGVYGTNCPIPSGKNFTYNIQVKDQIGSFFYFSSFAFHKAAGGYGAIRILSRPKIPAPFAEPAGDFTVLIGDWYSYDHTHLKSVLDSGIQIGLPNGVLINGRGLNGQSFTVEQGKTYRFRISNVGLQSTLNFRIEDHSMKLVEVERTHTQQSTYSSIDIHVGQSCSVLVRADQFAKDYYIAVSTRFTSTTLTSTSFLHYANSVTPATGSPPLGPTSQYDWSLNQARRPTLASGPRPNPQGSYHYGSINVTRTIRLSSSAGFIDASSGMQLTVYHVFRLGSIPDYPSDGVMHLVTSVMAADYRAFIEIIFENHEDIVQTWHLDGHSFFVAGMDGGLWSLASRRQYNLKDAISRCTTQVYPNSWTSVYVSLDNVGMWNLRTEFWARQYLGQQFYLRVYSPAESTRDENPIPTNALLCGRATK
ncbi:hypothetical protein C5167_013861 [Papaver somniferum]|uniref:Uncharacterized protein n=1 Tax=Papaver somniferum TaxID=3469 RepID=A0A4Y7J2I2_PAPSO|nr:hypothetical protein C5167_013861 [Papaver somniferum]